MSVWTRVQPASTMEDPEDVDAEEGQRLLDVATTARTCENASSTKREVDDVERQPKWQHTAIVCGSALLSSIQYCIVLPTAPAYAREVLGADSAIDDKLLMGGLIGGADIFRWAQVTHAERLRTTTASHFRKPLTRALGISLLLTFAMPRATTVIGYSGVFMMQGILGIVGNVIYSCAGVASSPWLLIGGRIVGGCTAAYAFTCPNFLGAFVGEKHRTAYFSLMNNCIYAGVALGPILGSLLLNYRGFPIGDTFSENTMPGWFMTAAFALAIVMLCIVPPFPRYEDSSAHGKEERSEGKGVVQSRAVRWNFPVLTCIWGCFVIAFLDGVWNSSSVLILGETFAWSEKATGYAIGLCLCAIFIGNTISGRLSYRFSDRQILAVALVALASSAAVMLVETAPVYIVASCVFMPSVTIGLSSYSSMLTKLATGPAELNAYQLWNGVMIQLALFVAAFFGTWGLSSIGNRAFFITNILLILSLVAFLVAKRVREEGDRGKSKRTAATEMALCT